MKYCAEGRGELASAAQQKSARFHGLPDSEIYTTEYIFKTIGNSQVDISLPRGSVLDLLLSSYPTH